MKVCYAYRGGFYRILRQAFDHLELRPLVAELGVLRGENAMALYTALKPRRIFLVDRWSMGLREAYSPFEELPPWVDPLESSASFFGGPTDDQKTFDELHRQCAARFEGKSGVEILRMDTIEAIPRIKEMLAGRKLDLVYIDANHQYEYVLRDLLSYQELLSSDGVLMLNDCCHSEQGRRQNLGVLEAVGNFVKRSGFIPVALTSTSWSDVMLARQDGQVRKIIDQMFDDSDIPYVEVPPQLLPAARLIVGKKTRISFV